MTTDGLHNLQAATRRSSKRIGRGNSSGKGSYSGRGIKGQRARAGGRRGMQGRSLKAFFQRVPKQKGFASRAALMRGINLSELETYFPKKGTITLKDFYTQGLLSNTVRRVKILGSGTVRHVFAVSAHAASASARAAIEKAGGRIVILTKEKKKRTKNPEKES